MRKSLVLFVLFCIGMCTSVLWAQKKVNGVVMDGDSDMPLIGASVVVKGTTNGIVTNLDGEYTLSDVKDTDILQFSYLGMITVEKTVGDQTVINVDLYSDTQKIDEVVVTALGIKREKKALGYAMQEVKGDQLTETRDANVANALAGRLRVYKLIKVEQV